MNYVTHSLGGMAAGLLVLSAVSELPPEGKVVVLGGAALGSLFPDVDHSQSWISRRIPISSAVVSSIFKHRGFLHTPVFIFLMAAVLPTISLLFFQEHVNYAAPFIMGFLPGMLSHLVLDTCNVGGILWLWPVTTKKYSLLPIRTGSAGEKVFACILGLTVACGIQALVI